MDKSLDSKSRSTEECKDRLRKKGTHRETSRRKDRKELNNLHLKILFFIKRGGVKDGEEREGEEGEGEG